MTKKLILKKLNVLADAYYKTAQYTEDEPHRADLIYKSNQITTAILILDDCIIDDKAGEERPTEYAPIIKDDGVYIRVLCGKCKTEIDFVNSYFANGFLSAKNFCFNCGAKVGRGAK
jgi:hypothetical protein